MGKDVFVERQVGQWERHEVAAMHWLSEFASLSQPSVDQTRDQAWTTHFSLHSQFEPTITSLLLRDTASQNAVIGQLAVLSCSLLPEIGNVSADTALPKKYQKQIYRTVSRMLEPAIPVFYDQLPDESGFVRVVHALSTFSDIHKQAHPTTKQLRELLALHTPRLIEEFNQSNHDFTVGTIRIWEIMAHMLDMLPAGIQQEILPSVMETFISYNHYIHSFPPSTVFRNEAIRYVYGDISKAQATEILFAWQSGQKNMSPEAVYDKQYKAALGLAYELQRAPFRLKVNSGIANIARYPREILAKQANCEEIQPNVLIISGLESKDSALLSNRNEKVFYSLYDSIHAKSGDSKSMHIVEASSVFEFMKLPDLSQMIATGNTPEAIVFNMHGNADRLFFGYSPAGIFESKWMDVDAETDWFFSQLLSRCNVIFLWACKAGKTSDLNQNIAARLSLYGPDVIAPLEDIYSLQSLGITMGESGMINGFAIKQYLDAPLILYRQGIAYKYDPF